MKFVNFIEQVQAVPKDNDIWITNDSFNDLAKECQVRLNEEGTLELVNGDTTIQVSFDSSLISSGGIVSVARVKEISGVYTKPNKPETCKVL